MQKDTSVPGGTIETFGFWFRTPLSDCQHWSIVPSGTERCLKTLTQHFVLGYFRWVPAGLIFTDSPTTCAIVIATFKLTRIGSRRTTSSLYVRRHTSTCTCQSAKSQAETNNCLVSSNSDWTGV